MRPRSSTPDRSVSAQPGAVGGPGAAPAQRLQAAVSLRAAQDRFIQSWSQMAGVWGISRTMAEVHALLYVTGEPMCTDDVMERLAISRGNASMSLRSLLEWGVVRRAHKRGDRKDYYQAELDVWVMFRAIARERIKREADPMVASLREIKELAPAVTHAAPDDLRALNRRLDELQEFFGLLVQLSERFAGPSGAGLKVAAKLLAKAPMPRRARRGGDVGAGMDAAIEENDGADVREDDIGDERVEGASDAGELA